MNFCIIWASPTGCYVGVCKVLAVSFQSYLTDVDKLATLLARPVSANVSHHVSILVSCLCHLLTTGTMAEHSAEADTNDSATEISSEVTRAVGVFVSTHGDWLIQRLQCITCYVSNM